MSDPKENDLYLHNKSHLQVNLRNEVWILQFETHCIESYDSSDSAERE